MFWLVYPALLLAGFALGVVTGYALRGEHVKSRAVSQLLSRVDDGADSDRAVDELTRRRAVLAPGAFAHTRTGTNCQCATCCWARQRGPN